MPTQNVNLPEHQAEFIRHRIKSGRYQNASEVVRAGLRLLEEYEEEYQLKLERLRAELQKALDDREHGRYIDINSEEELDAYFEEISRRGRERLAKEQDASPVTPK